MGTRDPRREDEGVERERTVGFIRRKRLTVGAEWRSAFGADARRAWKRPDSLISPGEAVGIRYTSLGFAYLFNMPPLFGR